MDHHHNPLGKCELKFEGEKGTFSGYASTFNSVDSDLDTILPGAFENTLKNSRPPHMFVNHRHADIPVGDWLTLKEDDRGLFSEGLIDLVHRDGPTLHSAMLHKRMDGLSIGFRVPPGGAVKHQNGGRTISQLDLVEISVVTCPADQDARILTVMKSEIQTIENFKDAELFLRDSGQLSRSTATALVSRIRAIIQSDSEAAREIAERKSAGATTDRICQLIRQY